jgi:hypothetical protein
LWWLFILERAFPFVVSFVAIHRPPRCCCCPLLSDIAILIVRVSQLVVVVVVVFDPTCSSTHPIPYTVSKLFYCISLSQQLFFILYLPFPIVQYPLVLPMLPIYEEEMTNWSLFVVVNTPTRVSLLGQLPE